jgi:hypothetical protein
VNGTDQCSIVSVWSLIFNGAFGLLYFLGSLTFAFIFSVQYGLPPVGVLCVFVGITLFIRSIRIRLRIGPNGILIRNVLRTVIVPWGEIDRIGWCEVGIGVGSPNGVHALAVKRRSGKILAVTATAGLGRNSAQLLAQTVHTFADQYGVPTDVTADDLYAWGVRRAAKTRQLR